MNTPSASLQAVGGDGSSPDSAIAFTGIESHFDVVAAEYTYLEGLHGPREQGWFFVEQSVDSFAGRKLDRMMIRTRDGRESTYYFDITEQYGKDTPGQALLFLASQFPGLKWGIGALLVLALAACAAVFKFLNA